MVRRDERRQPEVRELDHVAGRRALGVRIQQVLGLEVAVHDAVLVAVADRFHALREAEPRLPFTIVLLLDDAIEEFSTFT